jgi:hypothetical protein
MEKVNFWSIVHMTLILIVGLIQVKLKNFFITGEFLDNLSLLYIVNRIWLWLTNDMSVQLSNTVM